MKAMGIRVTGYWYDFDDHICQSLDCMTLDKLQCIAMLSEVTTYSSSRGNARSRVPISFCQTRSALRWHFDTSGRHL